MCGRVVQRRPLRELAELFDAEVSPQAIEEAPGPRYNLAPTDPVAVVVERAGGRQVAVHRWGLVPSWASDPSGAARLINARAETLASSPAFRQAFRLRRCIVPVDGFYEWQRRPDRRLPFLVRRRDGSPLALAGLWSPWRDPGTGSWLLTCSIVTTTPNALVATLHDRMPAILAPAVWDLWLDPKLPDVGELRALLRPAPDEELESYAVSPRVNSVRNDGADLLAPLVPSADLLQGRLF